MIWRGSIAGQMAVVLAVALLVAQAVSLVLQFQARERVQQAREDALVDRFVVEASNTENIRRLSNRPPRRRRGPMSVTNAPIAALGQTDERLTNLLQENLQAAELPWQRARAARMIRSPQDDPRQRDEQRLAIVLSAQLEDGRWFNGAMPAPRENRVRPEALFIQTILIYLALMTAVLLATRRLSRPLRRLADAAESFNMSGRDDPLPLEGPGDIRGLTTAFEEMRTRLRRAFNEKDVMLGAIGHDLRTPLTSLRIRVEQVENEKLRERMASTIEELSILLDDILVLARDGTPGTEPIQMDVTSLAQGVVDDLSGEDAPPVLEASGPAPMKGYPALLRRALRNLTLNGIRYGGAVTIRVKMKDDHILLAVDDGGPGVSEANLERLKEPFIRGEASRSRETGGAGLGLAIADGAARAHHGALELSNRPEGGFRAALRLPRGGEDNQPSK